MLEQRKAIDASLLRKKGPAFTVIINGQHQLVDHAIEGVIEENTSQSTRLSEIEFSRIGLSVLVLLC